MSDIWMKGAIVKREKTVWADLLNNDYGLCNPTFEIFISNNYGKWS